MEGFNGTIFCYGITGSGKTHTMTGPPLDRAAASSAAASTEAGAEAAERQQGIAQRAARRLFEFVADRGEQGEVFSVEASFLEVCPGDGSREVLVDLIGEGDDRPGSASEPGASKLEVRQDPLNPRAFSCEGLRRVPITSPDELCKILENGRSKCATMETTRNRLSSRSHCLLIVSVERLSAASASADGTAASGAAGPQRVKRGKLVLVDLAGSESLKKVMAAEDSQEELRRKQAIGINRVLTNLGVVVNNLNAGFDGNSAGFRASALTMLLKDCLGGQARALLVATISLEAEWASETFTTLNFAQQMMQVRNVERATYVDSSKSTLLQMQQRHLQCIRTLQQQGTDGSAAASGEEWNRLQGEVADLSRKLLTKDSAAEALERMQEEKRRKIEELRDEVSQTMTREFATLQEQSCRDLEGLKQMIEEKAKEGLELAAQAQRERLQAETLALRKQLEAQVEARRAAEALAEELRGKIAAAEEAATELEALQDRVAATCVSSDAERLEARREEEALHGRTVALEGERERVRTEAALRLNELERLRAARDAREAAARAELEAWPAEEAALQAEARAAQEQADAAVAQAAQAAAEAEARRGAELRQLEEEMARLEAEGLTDGAELEAARAEQALIEARTRGARQDEDELRVQFEEELFRLENDRDSSRQQVQEVMVMLEELQNQRQAAARAQQRWR